MPACIHRWTYVLLYRYPKLTPITKRNSLSRQISLQNVKIVQNQGIFRQRNLRLFPFWKYWVTNEERRVIILQKMKFLPRVNNFVDAPLLVYRQQMISSDRQALELTGLLLNILLEKKQPRHKKKENGPIFSPCAKTVTINTRKPIPKLPR